MTNTLGTQEALETTTKQSKQDTKDLTKKLVRDFLDEKLSGGDGVEFYNAAKWEKCIGTIREFKKYYQSRPEGSDPNKKKVIDSVEKEYLYSELVYVGVAIESKRTTLGEILTREFDLNSDQKELLKKDIGSLSLSELTKSLNYHTNRKALIDRLFPDQVEKPREQDFQKQFEAVFENNRMNPSEEQKQSIARLLASAHVGEQDIANILGYFPGETNKQLLVKYFLPTITLKGLQDLGIISETGVRDYIRDCVKKQFVGGTFPIDEDSIRGINPDDIILPTKLLPETDLNKLLEGSGKRAIVEQIEKTNQENIKKFEEGNTLGLTLDNEDKLLPSFQQKLRELGIKNPENFKEGSYIRGKIKQQDGTFQNFHFAIVGIDDNPERNRNNGGNGKQVTVMNILTGGGSINKNWRNSTPENPRNYSDIFALLKKAVKEEKGFPEIATQEALDLQVENGDIEETILRDDLTSRQELNNALDLIDKDGRKYPIEPGSSVQIGKPGDKNFWVFQIKSINENPTGGREPSIALSDGVTQEVISFQAFFDNFESQNGTRLPKIEGPESFLQEIKARSPKAKEFANIIYDKDRGVFVPENRKDDKNFPGVLQFGGEKQTITLHAKDSSGLAGWSVGEWDEKWRKYKSDAESYKGGWNALYAQFLTLRMTPKIPDVPLTPPEQKNAEMSEKHGYLKHYMGNPSLHDMFTGAKNLIGFIKHKLEHGSKLHASKFQLALGQKLGFSEAMMRELRNQVHGSNRELMEKMVKDFPSSTPERHKEILSILENHGSHDYEIQAATLSMLKKHGNLYVGALKKFDGSFLFFERLSGTKYGPNNPHVQRALAKCKSDGLLFREEFLIENYLQWAGSKEGGYSVDWNLWLDIKNSLVKEGIPNETKGGEDNAELFGELEPRLQYLYSKLEGGEYANGIGAMKKIWSKGGAPHLMHLPVMYLALSNIPNRLHTSQLSALRGEFGGGNPYPALAFLGSPGKQKIFQDTIKFLCKDDRGMRDAYAEVEKNRNKDVGSAIKSIRDFWNAYGPILHKQLIMSQDPKILYESKENETLSEYIKGYKECLPELGRLNEGQIGEGTYGYEHSGFTWAPDMYLKYTKIDRGPGTLQDDPGTQTIWNGYISSLKDIKKYPLTGSEEENRKFRYERYKEHHKAFYLHIVERMGSDWADEDKNGKIKMEKQNYMRDLQKLGFSRPPWKDKEKLETPEYDHIVQKDFEDYMSGGNKTTRDETETVATSISSLLG